MTHTIPLEEGHKAPFILVYKFNHLEIEAKRLITKLYPQRMDRSKIFYLMDHKSYLLRRKMVD